MNIKIIFAIFSAIFILLSFYPYIRDIFKRKTRPHAYTWLIWAITQGTAAAAVLYGDGGWGGASLILGTTLVFIIFLFSFWYGTRNITKWDTIILITALVAIMIWWQLDKPLISLLMVTGIDLIGYIPTFRKSFSDPWGETMISWLGFTVGNFFAIAALNEYSLLTVTYLAAISTGNIILVIFLKIRRRTIPKIVVNE